MIVTTSRLRFRPGALALALAAVACSSESNTGPETPITAVTVAPAPLSLILTQRSKLTATITGGFGPVTVLWSSSNPSIAAVTDSGYVTGVAAGTATVTATANGVAGTAAITVTTGAVDRVSVCDQANTGACTNAATLPAIGTAVILRASAFNTLGANISSSCTFQWTPSVPGAVSIAFFGDASKRDAVVTRTAAGALSILVSCSGVPGAFTINGTP